MLQAPKEFGRVRRESGVICGVAHPPSLATIATSPTMPSPIHFPGLSPPPLPFSRQIHLFVLPPCPDIFLCPRTEETNARVAPAPPILLGHVKKILGTRFCAGSGRGGERKEECLSGIELRYCCMRGGLRSWDDKRGSVVWFGVLGGLRDDRRRKRNLIVQFEVEVKVTE